MCATCPDSAVEKAVREKEGDGNTLGVLFVLRSLGFPVCTLSAASCNSFQALCSSLIPELSQGQEFLFLRLSPSRLIQNCLFSLPLPSEMVPGCSNAPNLQASHGQIRNKKKTSHVWVLGGPLSILVIWGSRELWRG